MSKIVDRFNGLTTGAQATIITVGTILGIGVMGAAAAPLLPDTTDNSSSPPSVAQCANEGQQNTKKEVVAFTTTTRDNATLAAGKTQTVQAGVNGERTITYKVVCEGDTATQKEVSNVVTTAPVEAIIENGTYVAPAPSPPVSTSSNCDPNYSGACVPVASDVDCGGGSGNGPAYVYSTVRVVGSDIYGLDRDGDGYGCD